MEVLGAETVRCAESQGSIHRIAENFDVLYKISAQATRRRDHRLTFRIRCSRHGPQLRTPNGHITRTPVGPGPALNTEAGEAAGTGSFPQNWQACAAISWSILSSENPSKGRGRAGKYAFLDCVQIFSPSKTRVLERLLLGPIEVALAVRYMLKALQTRRQRQSTAGDKKRKIRCQSSAGKRPFLASTPFCLASTDSLGFLAESSGCGIALSASRVSLSLRFVAECSVSIVVVLVEAAVAVAVAATRAVAVAAAGGGIGEADRLGSEKSISDEESSSSATGSSRFSSPGLAGAAWASDGAPSGKTGSDALADRRCSGTVTLSA